MRFDSIDDIEDADPVFQSCHAERIVGDSGLCPFHLRHVTSEVITPLWNDKDEPKISKLATRCRGAQIPSLFTLSHGPFNIRVDATTPLYCDKRAYSLCFLDPGKISENKGTGYGVFMLPTQCDYKLSIAFDKDEKNTFGGASAGGIMGYQVVSASFDDKKIDIDSTIWRSGGMDITGLTLGGNDSFKFVTFTESDLAASVDPSKVSDTTMEVPEHLNKRNVITLTLQRVLRTKKAPPPKTFFEFGGEFGLFGNTPTPGSGGTNMFGIGPVAQPYSYTPPMPQGGACGFGSLGGALEPPPVTRGFGAGGLFGYEPAKEKTNFFERRSESKPTGGTTVSGGHYVAPTHAAHDPTSVFEHKGEPLVITIQLIDFQRDHIKQAYNMNARLTDYYYLVNEGRLLDADVQSKEHRIKTLEDEIREMQVKINSITSVRSALGQLAEPFTVVTNQVPLCIRSVCSTPLSVKNGPRPSKEIETQFEQLKHAAMRGSHLYQFPK